MCRNPLQRYKICIQIKVKIKLIETEVNPLIFNNSANFDRRVTPSISRNGDITSRMFLSVTLPELNESTLYTHPRGILNSIYRGTYLQNRIPIAIN
jgi:hypothetical protein